MTPGGLQSIRDNLYCHLYDETVIDLLEDDRQRTTNIHQRMERHWLGSLAIPFASLLKAHSAVQSASVCVWLVERDSHHRHAWDRPIRALPISEINFSNSVLITVHPPLHLPNRSRSD
ncbi:hypothetical protein LSTR_LSTR011826 [Laodelphax striatellus]|uniref:Uncharacterized protein n=1 Tax=Laodelphax striatellus TaxID=195883 RepID=A0A482WIR3_LAOST|nr:hypothetical protein LSTR_LSTR011826 [Laodelphax striatellus]